MATAGQAVTEVLVKHGVDRVYALAGESFLGVLDALRQESRIDVVTVHHEGSGGFMAVGDARLTGNLGVLMVSRGPGATNASIALHTAKDDAVPMCLIVGQVGRKFLRRDGFQEIDYANVFGDIAKWVVEISDPSRTRELLARAIQVAYSGTPGPVVVVLPEDMQADDAGQSPMPPAYRRPYSAPDAGALDEIAAMLAKAERPLFIAGGELATDAGRAALLHCAQAWGIPATVTFRRHDLFPNADPLFAGDLGLQTTQEQIAAFQESDLIIAVGTRLGDLSTQGYTFPDNPKPRQPFVHVYGDAAVIGRHFVPDIGMVCDAAQFLGQLAVRADAGAASRNRPWAQRLRALRTAVTAWKPKRADDGIVFGNVVAALGPRLAKDAIVVLDAGMAAAQAYRYIEWTPAQRLLAPITGSMGFGISAAIAAALRYPGREVILIAGDGGFLMSCAELALVNERRLPIRFIVANNQSYGVIRLHQEDWYGPLDHIGTDLSTPDFAMLARAFGLGAETVAAEEDVGAALDRLMGADGAALVEIKTSLYAQLPPR
ncbi:Acetolactate synthase isozyme 2 large subunit [Pigmentiphaga humi]|uniref:Acetolactate synthase isozyme 2 large subunit n=1 Tax=Pigmentiphaga humi TaxID=2478468 RepID=A0A3P4B5P3_9BURK|nr:thiamine pyrophosphate-dependent enzyme [Pigmentiphaga humi]VCU71623.1 Acetolactate synthase isozyme 2 large subunit [Pigmentiphaga humi]